MNTDPNAIATTSAVLRAKPLDVRRESIRVIRTQTGIRTGASSSSTGGFPPTS